MMPRRAHFARRRSRPARPIDRPCHSAAPARPASPIFCAGPAPRRRPIDRHVQEAFAAFVARFGDIDVEAGARSRRWGCRSPSRPRRYHSATRLRRRPSPSRSPTTAPSRRRRSSARAGCRRREGVSLPRPGLRPARTSPPPDRSGAGSARERCASATISTLRASRVSRPARPARTMSAAVVGRAGDDGGAGRPCGRGMDRPVTIDSSTVERTSSMVSSTGTPGRARSRSPAGTSLGRLGDARCGRTIRHVVAVRAPIA